jgi:hypothetical protein
MIDSRIHYMHWVTAHYWLLATGRLCVKTKTKEEHMHMRHTARGACA